MAVMRARPSRDSTSAAAGEAASVRRRVGAANRFVNGRARADRRVTGFGLVAAPVRGGFLIGRPTSGGLTEKRSDAGPVDRTRVVRLFRASGAKTRPAGLDRL